MVDMKNPINLYKYAVRLICICIFVAIYTCGNAPYGDKQGLLGILMLYDLLIDSL